MPCQLYPKMCTTIGILPKEMQQKISMLKDENTKLQVIRHRNYPINYFHACILSFSKINSKKIISTKNAKSCTQFKFLVHSTQITPAQWSLVLIIHSVGPIMDRPLTTNLCMHWAKLPIELMVIFFFNADTCRHSFHLYTGRHNLGNVRARTAKIAADRLVQSINPMSLYCPHKIHSY